MRSLKLCLWTLFFILVQTTACRYMKVGGVFPDLVFVFIVCFAVFEKKFARVAVIAVICGLLSDFLISGRFGAYTIVYASAALICYFIGEHFIKERLLFAVPAVFVLSIFGELLFYIMSVLRLGYSGLFGALIHIILPAAIYNMVLTFVIYPVLKRTVYHNNIGRI